MAWKVIGFHNASGDGPSPRTPRGTMRNPTWDYRVAFGPHPRKAWVKTVGERRARLPKAKNALAGSDGATKREVNERMAINYALWLAKRDGIELPRDRDGYVVRGKPFWNTALSNGKPEPRIASVSFHGKTGGQIIQIPNWDWTPAEPVETIVPLDEAFEDLGKRAMATLLDCLMAA
jgi:hypothetical protein